MLHLSCLIALLVTRGAESQQQRQKQRVYATSDIKDRLQKHNLVLVPGPPLVPTKSLVPDGQFAALTAEDFGGMKLFTEQGASCFKGGEHLRWASEGGEVLVNGRRVFIKGLNWAWSIGTFMEFLAAHRFNSLRLPFSLEWALMDPTTQPNQYLVLPEIRGLSIGNIFEKILDAAASHGIIILLDLHVLRVSEGLQDLWYEDGGSGMTEDVVIKGWESLLKRVANRWNVFAIDIKNEPHGAATWGTGDTRTDWNDFVERLIRRLVKNVPEFTGLFFVEGIEDPYNPDPVPHWWGGNLNGVKTRPIRTGNADADRRVVYSPHIYGPEVYEHAYFDDPRFPENLFDIWDEMLGFVESRTGRAMVVGEWGGTIMSSNSSKAGPTQQKLAEWFVSRCVADQYWWCLNPSTSHNGGMLGETYASVDMNVLTLLDYVQPQPTTFHVRDNGAICVVEGSYANPRCALKAGLPLNSTLVTPHKP